MAPFAGRTPTWLIERRLCFAWKRYGFVFSQNNKFLVLDFSKVAEIPVILLLRVGTIGMATFEHSLCLDMPVFR